MSIELNAMLHLMFYQTLEILIFTGIERFIEKDKKTAKKIAERLGLVLFGMAESTLVVFLCWLFG